MKNSGLMAVIDRQLTEAVKGYSMPPRAVDVVQDSNILLLSGVTAAGKNTIINYLTHKADYEFVVSHTTRAPRMNHGQLEKNGEVYWFVSKQEMLKLVEEEAFVEVKAVHGHTVYGTSIAAIEHAMKAGKIPVKEPDVQGALEYVKAFPGMRPVFVLPPSYEVWMQRLSQRGAMNEEERERRFASARYELKMAIEHPAFLLVVNHEVEDTAAEIISGNIRDRDTQPENRELAKRLLDAIS